MPGNRGAVDEGQLSARSQRKASLRVDVDNRIMFHGRLVPIACDAIRLRFFEKRPFQHRSAEPESSRGLQDAWPRSGPLATHHRRVSPSAAQHGLEFDCMFADEKIPIELTDLSDSKSNCWRRLVQKSYSYFIVSSRSPVHCRLLERKRTSGR